MLEELHKYVPKYDANGTEKYSTQALVADQLSVERGVNALLQISNGFTPKERLEGLHIEVADWHAGNKFIKVCISIQMFAGAGREVLKKVHVWVSGYFVLSIAACTSKQLL